MEIQWSLILFTVITGIAGWGYATLSLEEVRGKVGKEGFLIGLVLLIVLAVGGCASVTHLSHPENMLAALTHPTSGIFVEAVLVGITGLAGLIYLIVKKREGSATACKAFAIVAGVFGVVLSFMAGESYVVASQPAWNTQLMPLGYCLTAAPGGIALYVLLAASKGDIDDSRLLCTLLGASGVVGALIAIAWGAASTYLAAIGTSVGIAVAGTLVASLLGWFARPGKNVVAFAAVALVCVFVGAVAYRYGMWTVGYGINNFFGSV